MPNSALEFAPVVEDHALEPAVEEDVVVQAPPKPKRTKPKPPPVDIAPPEPVKLIVYARRKAPRLSAGLVARLRESARVAQFQPQPLPLPADPLECDVNTKRIVEAILFAANKPMTVKQIQQTFPELEQPELQDIQAALASIALDYQSRPIGLKLLASGYRFQVKEGMSPWVTRLFEEKPARYSRALLETVAIIAYRQPVTRGEIEDIRGVSVSSSIIQTLLEREWIRVIAHKEVPGRPALFGTTKQFLDYFNLASLSELPTLQEIVDLDFSQATPSSPQQESRERSQTISAENQSSPENAESEAEQFGSGQTETRAENTTRH